jgi:transmembrane sensor
METSTQKRRLPSTDIIHSQAASWIAQLDAGPLSDADRLALTEWMARSPAHKKELQRLAALWGQVDQLFNDAVEQSIDQPTRAVSITSLWAKVSPFHFTGYASAACALLFLVVFGLANLQHVFDGEPTSIIYQTQIGESENFHLPDGSVASLNTGSILKFENHKEERVVQLFSGEALFEVKKDAKRPFRVYAGETVVEAVGTAFLVRVENEGINVAVTEGVVKLSETLEVKTDSGQLKTEINPTSTLARLSAGQGASVNYKKPEEVKVSTLSVKKIEKLTAWIDGFLIFDTDTLEHVVGEIARYQSKKIVISDPELGSLEMSGVFKTGEIDVLLNTLETAFNIEVIHARDDLIYLNKKG